MFFHEQWWTLSPKEVHSEELEHWPVKAVPLQDNEHESPVAPEHRSSAVISQTDSPFNYPLAAE